MSSVAADTHAALWYLREPNRLSVNAVAAFQQTASAGDVILVAANSVVDVCYLIEKASLPAKAYDEFIAALNGTDTPLTVVPLDMAIAQMLRHIPRDLVPDMPDRFVAATALHLGLPLVTRDSKIRTVAITTIW